MGDLKDIEHLQNKKFTGLKVPKSWMALERDVNAKSTLTEQEVQFARTVRRIQYALQEGLRQLFDLALVLRGLTPSECKYSIMFPNMSTVDEMRQWQIEEIRQRVAAAYQTQFSLSDEYVMRKHLGMTQDEIDDALANQQAMPTAEEMEQHFQLTGKLPNPEATVKDTRTLENLSKKASDLEAIRARRTQKPTEAQKIKKSTKPPLS